MSIYTCPHCKEKTFNPITKGLAGQLNSRGKECPKCGTRCVNGKGATIFNAIFSAVILVCMVALYLNSQNYDFLAIREIPLMIMMILSLLVVPKVVNAFFFRMEEAIRRDI